MMNRISDYQGCFLNHLEGIYRAEDRDLAVELAEAIGLTVKEMRFTANSRPIIAAHPNADDRDATNNVIFLYEMPDKQRKLLDLLAAKMASDPELRAAADDYRSAVQAMPPIMPHFGLRYGSEQALRTVTDTIEHGLSDALKERVALFEVPPYAPIEGLPDIRQVFVRTDVLTTGAMGFEQAIELQVERGRR